MTFIFALKSAPYEELASPTPNYPVLRDSFCPPSCPKVSRAFSK